MSRYPLHFNDYTYMLALTSSMFQPDTFHTQYSCVTSVAYKNVSLLTRQTKTIFEMA